MDYFVGNKILRPEKGDLLISNPYLADPNFERTVVLICEHDQNGTLGFVLNRPSELMLEDVLNDVPILNMPVFIGGPVQQDTLNFIHQDFDQLKSGIHIHQELYWGGDYEEWVNRVKLGILNTSAYRFFIGYSGWSPGQLEEEMASKSWIIYKKVPKTIVFDLDPEHLWKEVLKNMGGQYRVIANYPQDPRLN